jgi:RecA/RadA recombinase
MSAKLDEILNGGITIGKVTEVAGVAGVGKTQFWYKTIKPKIIICLFL